MSAPYVENNLKGPLVLITAIKLERNVAYYVTYAIAAWGTSKTLLSILSELWLISKTPLGT